MNECDQEIQKAEAAIDRATHVLSNRWLRVSTVCRRLDVKKLTIYRWIDRGVFRASDLSRTPGGHWRIRESAITELERAGTPKHVA